MKHSNKTNGDCKIYQFEEHAMVIRGEEHDILELAEALRTVRKSGVELPNTISDLLYKIEYAFDMDDVRTTDTETPYDPNFTDQYLV